MNMKNKTPNLITHLDDVPPIPTDLFESVMTNVGRRRRLRSFARAVLTLVVLIAVAGSLRTSKNQSIQTVGVDTPSVVAVASTDPAAEELSYLSSVFADDPAQDEEFVQCANIER